jgi:RNA-directed DNA polymerase
VNTEADPVGLVDQAERSVLVMQTKLHRWAVADPSRRFDDVFNLVYDPSFLLVAWNRVRTNKGGRTAGVDGVIPKLVPSESVLALLGRIRVQVKAQEFTPRPVKAVQIPKANGTMRQLGIPVMADRIVQAALKLVLEPIFEADFDPASYGFRPGRSAHDAIAEIHLFASNPCNYHWVFEADIKACFDNIDHTYLMGQMARRIKDKKLRGLVWKFLKAGIVSEQGIYRSSDTGTPQGGILSPLLANIALTSLDQHFRDKWNGYGTDGQRSQLRKQGHPTMRLVRYADDFVVMVHGQRSDAEALFDEVTHVLAPIGLALSTEKTRVVHIDEGFDFLGWHIQRRTKKGTRRKVVYTYPSKKAVASITGKIRTLTARNMHDDLAALLVSLNRVLRGWSNYFRLGSSKKTLTYVDHYAFTRVMNWVFKRHPTLGKRTVHRRYMPRWRIQDQGISLFRPGQVPVTYPRYRGNRIPNPWTTTPRPATA